MAETSRAYAPLNVPTDSASAELAVVLADPRFKTTTRNRAFLKYIAEGALEGRSGAKAYSIAIDVFGRGPDFDASSDPIVRIEATRLRNALDQYYLSFGAFHDVHIHLPRGRYVAEFERRPMQEPEPTYRLVALHNTPKRSATARASLPRAFSVTKAQVVVIALAAMMVGASGLMLGQIFLR